MTPMLKNYNATRIACYIGYITQAITINLAPLFFIIFQDRYEVSFSRIGQLVLITFIIQLLVDLVCIGIVEKIGYRALSVAAHVFAAFGLILLGVLPPLFDNAYTGILIAVFFYSIGGGLTEVVISPLVDALPSDAKASSMSLLHSFYSWGQCLVVLVTTLVLFVIGQERWMILPVFWALIPAADAVLFCLVPIPEAEEGGKERHGIRDLLGSGMFYVCIVLMICGGASEQTMSQWASLFAEKAIGVSKVVGDLLGPCLFAILMGIGRTAHGVLGQRLKMAPALFGCAALSVLCYVLTVFSASPVLALIGCAVCGFGVSLMWPGVLSLSAARFPRAGGPMFAMLALAGDMGCSLGPWISGIVSDATEAGVWPVFAGIAGEAEQLAMKNGMLVATVFPLVMFALLAIFLIKKKGSDDGSAAE